MWWVPPAQVPACAKGAAGGGGAGPMGMGSQPGAGTGESLGQTDGSAGSMGHSPGPDEGTGWTSGRERSAGGGGGCWANGSFQGRRGDARSQARSPPCSTISPDTLASSEPSRGLVGTAPVTPHYGRGKAAQALEKVPGHTQRDLAVAGTAPPPPTPPNPVPCLQPHCRRRSHQPRRPRECVTRS